MTFELISMSCSFTSN